MLNERSSWKEYEALASHYKAIGEMEIYLYKGECQELPYHLVTRCEEGGTYSRWPVASNVRFSAVGPSGLRYSWTVDLLREDRKELDTAHLSLIMQLLSPEGRNGLKKYLAICADSVRVIAEAHKMGYESEMKNASDLELLSEM